MPKRSRKRRYSDDSDDYIRKKIRKLEKKLRRKKDESRSRSISSERDCPNNSSFHEDESSDDEIAIMTAGNHSPKPATGVAEPVTPTVTTSEGGAPPLSSTSVSDQATAVAPELDKEILDLLGETPSKDKKYGPKIQDDLSVRWSHVLTSGLTKDVRKELIDKYLIPENCKLMDAPILNPETKAALSEALTKKDKAIENKQKEIAAALSCLGHTLTRLIEIGNKDVTIIKPLLDATRLICDVQHTESLIRRSFICSSLKKDVKEQLYQTEIDRYLFSEKLSDALKAAKAIQKSGVEMKIPTARNPQGTGSTTRPLNPKGSTPAGRPAAGAAKKDAPAATPPTRRAPPQSNNKQSTQHGRSRTANQRRR